MDAGNRQYSLGLVGRGKNLRPAVDLNLGRWSSLRQLLVHHTTCPPSPCFGRRVRCWHGLVLRLGACRPVYRPRDALRRALLRSHPPGKRWYSLGESELCSWQSWNSHSLASEIKQSRHISSLHRGDQSPPYPASHGLSGRRQTSLGCGRSSRDERVQVFRVHLQGNANE